MKCVVFIVQTICMMTVSTAFASEPFLSSMVENFYEHTQYLHTSGQPDSRTLDKLDDFGYELVISLSPETLPSFNRKEKRILEKAGIDYRHIPVSWENPALEQYDAFQSVLREFEGKKVLVHCWLNSRSSAFVYVYRVSERLEAQEEELEILKKIWSRNKGYELTNVPHWEAFLDRAIAQEQ